MSPHRPVCLHESGYRPRDETTANNSPIGRASQRAVVVGGVPRGLKPARVLGERGHNIVLFEAAPKLGGQVLMGLQASWRGDLSNT